MFESRHRNRSVNEYALVNKCKEVGASIGFEKQRSAKVSIRNINFRWDCVRRDISPTTTSNYFITKLIGSEQHIWLRKAVEPTCNSYTIRPDIVEDEPVPSSDIVR